MALWCNSMESDRAPPGQKWLTAKEAAGYLNVHLRTLYRYTRQRKNKPPFVRFTNGGTYRFPRTEFIQWANGGSKGQ
jgi:excisionase family DNA binding protein